ncbi:MAG: murein L,D-transpeptidase catalytic domain family protein [Bacteriovorax sp.]|nr:murein L,D-transpeptidase catalytic domain family protein [Bacteriovorax sp.]
MMNRQNLFSKSLVLALLIASHLLCFEASARSTKEIWLEFTGSNFCQKSFCADGIPANVLEIALNYFKKNQKLINNVDFLTIIDFTKLSIEKRMFILNLKNGSVESLLVTHGKKSEGELGQAKYFSNTPGSEMSSIGFFVTDSVPYVGKHGDSLRINGLSKTNSNALMRNIVIHGADYATQWFADERGRLGLSQGCPAVAPNKVKGVITKLKGESLLYIHSDQQSI